MAYTRIIAAKGYNGRNGRETKATTAPRTARSRRRRLEAIYKRQTIKSQTNPTLSIVHHREWRGGIRKRAGIRRESARRRCLSALYGVERFHVLFNCCEFLSHHHKYPFYAHSSHDSPHDQSPSLYRPTSNRSHRSTRLVHAPFACLVLRPSCSSRAVLGRPASPPFTRLPYVESASLTSAPARPSTRRPRTSCAPPRGRPCAPRAPPAAPG
jgi:hypothetical protein